MYRIALFRLGSFHAWRLVRSSLAIAVLMGCQLAASLAGEAQSAKPQSGDAAAGDPAAVAVGERAGQREIAFFETHIRPALLDHCLDCHSTETETSGGLALDSRAGWSTGGDLGPAVVPGKPDESLLIQAIEYDDPGLQMPPDGKLDASVIAALRRWVRDGAADPRRGDSQVQSERQTGLPVEQAEAHWAYRPRQRPATDRGGFGPRQADPEQADPEQADPEQADPEQGGGLIDALIEQQLAEAGLEPTPVADRRALIRRLTFDLHGLPPRIEDVEAFVHDRSPDAYQRLVDRLLASPRFGEHFARRWMDVVRYAESITLRGFVLPQSWRYRDYLIEAFASDRPFDRMILDHIAGDLLPADDIHETQLRAVATGFLAMGNSNLEDQDKTKLEFDYIDEQLETIGRAFLAQTIGCARCHDHKFDPIPTRDYYALAGIFRSTKALNHANLSKWIEKPLPLEAEAEARYRRLQREVDAVSAELKKLDELEAKHGGKLPKKVDSKSLDGIVIDDSQAKLVGSWSPSTFIGRFVGDGYRHDEHSGQGSKTATFEPEALPPGRYEVRLSYTAQNNRASNVRVTVFSANESKTIVVNQRKRPPVDGLWISLGEYPFEKNGQAFVMVSNEDADGHVIIDAIQFLPVGAEQAEVAEDAEPSLSAAERKRIASRRKTLTSRRKRLKAELDARPKYLTISESEPKEAIAIRIRGEVHQLGQEVPRGFLSAIPPAESYAPRIGADASGRVALARWIADARNPLTARVYVNRLWSWLMGEGLVTTENNFGTTGAAPSHPRLLDHLANELVDRGWSTKAVVRMIVRSRAYRRSLSDDPQRMAVDPENRLYAGGSLKRLPVEAIRDAMLAVSGELDLALGGSLIRPGTSSDYNYRHDSVRRSVYQPVFRNSLPALFKVFDFADPSVSVGQRSRSTVAPQSLAMMNHPWVIERARQASRRLLADPALASPRALIDHLYRSCFARPPRMGEMELCLQFLKPSVDPNEAADESDGRLPDPVRLGDLIQSLFASVDFRYLE